MNTALTYSNTRQCYSTNLYGAKTKLKETVGKEVNHLICSQYVALLKQTLNMRHQICLPVLEEYLIIIVHSLTHPQTHSLTHPPTHSLTHPLTHSLTHPLTHSPTYPVTFSLIHSPGTVYNPCCTHCLDHWMDTAPLVTMMRKKRCSTALSPTTKLHTHLSIGIVLFRVLDSCLKLYHLECNAVVIRTYTHSYTQM